MIQKTLSTREGVSMADKEADLDTPMPEIPTSADTDESQKDSATATNVDTDEDVESTGKDDTNRKLSKSAARQVSISVRTLAVGAVIAVLLAGVAVLAWLYIGAENKIDDAAVLTANKGRAEQIALDYAVGAAKIDFEHLDAWKADLVKGTTPELNGKLSDAAKSMEQILVPLQWKSSATPLVAKVRTDDNGMYVVDTFVGVETKTVQAPDGLQSTATYSITVDSNHDWQISEVGGVGAVVGQK